MRSGFPVDWPVALGANTSAPAKSVAADRLITIRCFIMVPPCVPAGWRVRAADGPVNLETPGNALGGNALGCQTSCTTGHGLTVSKRFKGPRLLLPAVLAYGSGDGAPLWPARSRSRATAASA